MYDYDVVFVGSGHAIWHGALILLAAGKRLAIVEQAVTGGTCTNFGCNAKYLLDTPFDFIDGLEKYRGLGVDELPEISWPELMAYKKANIGPMHLGLEAGFAKAGIEMVRGTGKLVDAHTVEADGRQLTADYIVLGTGERPNRLNVVGKELLHDSTDFLDLDELPARIALVGAGIISMEFASITAKMGVETTVIEYGDRALRNYPARYVDTLVAKMQEEGVRFLFNEGLTSVEQRGDAVVLTMASGTQVEADYALDAIGRIPNVEGIGLKDVGVAFSRRGIQVNEFMQTTVPNIYASGDCVDKLIPKLTPTAEFESNYIAGHILGNPAPISYPAIPNLVFTLPRVAQTGVSVDEALAKPDEYRVVSVPYGQTITFMAKSDTDADFTYVFDKDDNFVGAAMYGVDAGELINVATMIINLGLTRTDMAKMIFSFPGTTYGMLSSLIPALKA